MGKLGLDEREHKRLVMTFPSGRRVKISLSWSMFTVSRRRLNQALLEQALAAGAEFHPEKIVGVAVEDGTALVRSGVREYEADLVVGADGVHSRVRQDLAKPLPRSDLCLTYSANLPGKIKLPIILKFFKGVEGYAWIFPRNSDTSVGIAMENAGMSSSDLKTALQEFVTFEFRRGGLDPPVFAGLRGYYLPSLRPATFAKPTLGGPGGALVGDASGACDPLTGEGIYYALQTAQYLGQALCSTYPDYFSTYQMSWKAMAENSLIKVSNWRSRFYKTRNLNLLGYCVDYSPSIRNLTRDLLAGMQEYNSLKERILGRWSKYAYETIYYTLTRQRGERS
jgi:flavin-dependent dehydrogenase